MFSMNIPGLPCYDNTWSRMEEEVEPMRRPTTLIIRSIDVKTAASTPDSTYSEPDLDLATFIPSPTTFFAQDFASEVPAAQQNQEVADVTMREEKLEEPLEKLEPNGVKPKEKIQESISSQMQMRCQMMDVQQEQPPEFVHPDLFIPIPRNPCPSDYVTIPAHYFFMRDQIITFLVFGPTENGIIFPSPEHFLITCIDPHGDICIGTVRYSWPIPSHYVFSFQATIPGIYIAKVKYWNQMEIPMDIFGSPLNLSVSRNYENSLTKTFTQLGNYVKVWGIDFDRNTKRVYVTDKRANRVRIYSPEGFELIQLGLNTQGILNRPSGLAVDHRNNRIIISDKDNHRIVFFTLDGIFIGSFGQRGFLNGCFEYPWGVAVSPNGELIAVADSRNHRIQMFDRFGNYLRKYSAYESHPFEYKSMFDYPRAICFDRDGQHLYCTDFNIHAVFKFSIDLMEMITFVGPGCLLRPQGLTVDEAGNILVCDRNVSVRVFTPQGQLMAVIHGNGQFNLPQDLCVLPTGELLILDDGNNLIHLY